MGFDFRTWVQKRDLSTNFLGSFTFNSTTVSQNGNNGTNNCATAYCGTGNATADFLLGYYGAASTFQPGPFSQTVVDPRAPRLLALPDSRALAATAEGTVLIARGGHRRADELAGTALPTIAGDLHGLNHLAWVVTAYLLASTISTPLWGKLGDLYGRKNLFLFAIVVFLLGSALCGLAQSMTQLVLFRAVQGIGAGGLFPLQSNARLFGLLLRVL